MIVNINVSNLMWRLLPSHLRKPVRHLFLRCLVSPLESIISQLFVMRKDTILEIATTPQRLAMIGYIKAKYSVTDVDIKESDDGSISVGLQAEGEIFVMKVGLESEEIAQNFALEGEVSDSFGDVDFKVYVPSSVPLEEVTADVERRKPVATKYEIVR